MNNKKNDIELKDNAKNIKQCLIFLKGELKKMPFPFSVNLIGITIDGLDDEIKSKFSKKH